MRYDLHQREREAATVHPNGTKSLWVPSVKVVTHYAGIGYFWMPKAKNPLWLYSFKTREQFVAKAKEQSDAYDAHLAQKTKDRANRKPTEAVLRQANPGAIFSYSWGYDQTNIEYWQVVKRTGATVTIARIFAESAGDSGGRSQEHIRATPDAFAMVCGHPKTDWEGKPTICGSTRDSLKHRNDLGRILGQQPYEHEFVPVQDTLVKKVGTTGAWGKTEDAKPILSFPHGCGSLVKQVRTGNAPPLVVGSDYKTAFGYGH